MLQLQLYEAECGVSQAEVKAFMQRGGSLCGVNSPVVDSSDLHGFSVLQEPENLLKPENVH